MAAIRELPGIRVLLLSAADIAQGLDTGEIHLGVSGEDLLREREAADTHVLLLRALGFGPADLVVAAPASWIDVETMADLEEVGAAYVARTGRRMRVATKYMVQTRGFFAAHGVVDYRIVESSGATEGAGGRAGGADRRHNDHRRDVARQWAAAAGGRPDPQEPGAAFAPVSPLTGPRSSSPRPPACLASSRARARALATVLVSWPAEQETAARSATESFLARGATRRAQGLLVGDEDLLDVADALAAASVGPVSVVHPNFAFEGRSEAAETLARRLGLRA